LRAVERAQIKFTVGPPHTKLVTRDSRMPTNVQLRAHSTLVFDQPPVGWHVCDGGMLAISANTALFSLLGTAFGGDGKTNFGVPNLLDKVPISQGNYYIAMQGVYPQRA
jgi:microcystin-dependent protein